MKEKYRNALVEVDEILEQADEESLKEIPLKFREFVKENKSTTYKPNFDYSKNITDQELLHETKVILATMYKDYWATDEEKEELKKKQEERENEKKEKYKYEDIFKNATEDETEEKTNELVTTEEKGFKRFIREIWRKIAGLFSNSK